MINKQLEYLINNDIGKKTHTFYLSENLPEVTIKGMTAGEHAKIRGKCINYNSAGLKSFDSCEYYAQLIANYTIEPDFRDAKLVEATGLSTGAEVAKNRLTPKEFDKLGNEILKLAGISGDVNKDIKDAKKQ